MPGVFGRHIVIFLPAVTAEKAAGLGIRLINRNFISPTGEFVGRGQASNAGAENGYPWLWSLRIFYRCHICRSRQSRDALKQLINSTSIFQSEVFTPGQILAPCHGVAEAGNTQGKGALTLYPMPVYPGAFGLSPFPFFRKSASYSTHLSTHLFTARLTCL
jgi:hypothetical protein